LSLNFRLKNSKNRIPKYHSDSNLRPYINSNINAIIVQSIKPHVIRFFHCSSSITRQCSVDNYQSNTFNTHCLSINYFNSQPKDCIRRWGEIKEDQASTQVTFKLQHTIGNSVIRSRNPCHAPSSTPQPSYQHPSSITSLSSASSG